jgi:omega-amidase
MRAHLIQMDITWEDKQANYDKAERLIARAGPSPGDFLLLPEMFDTGFSFNVERTADADLASLQYLTQLARDLEVYVQGARTVLHNGQAENRATVIGPDGSVLADYAKIHPFSLGKEHERFPGGREVLTYSVKVEGQALSFCPAICYDLRFPELFRIGLQRGAEVFALGANWPQSRAHHWRSLLIARAIENQAFVLGVNRTGNDPNLAYAGGSIAINPRGEILGELGPEEAPLSVEIDPLEVHTWREKFPAWKDARLAFSPRKT